MGLYIGFVLGTSILMSFIMLVLGLVWFVYYRRSKWLRAVVITGWLGIALWLGFGFWGYSFEYRQRSLRVAGTYQNETGHKFHLNKDYSWTSDDGALPCVKGTWNYRMGSLPSDIEAIGLLCEGDGEDSMVITLFDETNIIVDGVGSKYEQVQSKGWTHQL